MNASVFIHVQHLLGTGHVVRAAAIGKALATEGLQVTLASGNTIPPTLDTGPLEVVSLPACKSPDASFKRLVTPANEDIDETWKSGRVQATLEAFHARPCDLLLTETYPFGRRQLDFELTPLLDAAKARPTPPLVATSIRDILVRKKELWKERWMADQARTYYDRILIHADPDFVRLEDSFPFADDVSDLVRYTGYVGGRPSSPANGEEVNQDSSEDGRDEVIVSCGGGAVAGALIGAALEARALSRRAGDARWRLLLGHDVREEEFARYSHTAADGVIVERARPDFPELLTRARLSVSQAGYNTVLDILSAGVPSVLVPFAQVNETEQTQRAEALVRHGRAVMTPEAGLTPERLAASADAALALPRSQHAVRLGGAAESARILIEDLKERGR